MRWLVCLFLVWALFQSNKVVGIRHAGGPGLNPGRSPTIRVLYQRENVILISKTLSEKAITILHNWLYLHRYLRVINNILKLLWSIITGFVPSSFPSLIFRFEPIFVRPKRIFSMSVLFIARNFADNRTINTPKFTHIPSRNSRILTNFVEVCYHHFRTAFCHYCWKRKGNVFYAQLC